MNTNRFFKEILLIVLLFCGGCGQKRMSEKDRKAIADGMKDQEIKKVKEGKITEATFELGRKLTKESQIALSQSLIQAIDSSGISGALQYCNHNALPILDSVAKGFGVEVRRVSNKRRNAANKPDVTEKPILDAYAYSLGQGEALHDNVQELENGYLLYTKPILINNPLCLGCHGTPGATIKDADVDKIKALYPNDSATGYSLGELRGMWSARFSRKMVVKGI